MKEGEDPEDGEAKEEGVTFNIWKKTEQPPPAEPVFDEVIHVDATRNALLFACFNVSFYYNRCVESCLTARCKVRR